MLSVRGSCVLSVRGSRVERFLPKLRLMVCHHQKGGVCEYKINTHKEVFDSWQTQQAYKQQGGNRRTQGKARIGIWNRAGRPTIHLGRPNSSKMSKRQKSCS